MYNIYWRYNAFLYHKEGGMKLLLQLLDFQVIIYCGLQLNYNFFFMYLKWRDLKL